jgi:hypothetical protein
VSNSFDFNVFFNEARELPDEKYFQNKHKEGLDTPMIFTSGTATNETVYASDFIGKEFVDIICDAKRAGVAAA